MVLQKKHQSSSALFLYEWTILICFFSWIETNSCLPGENACKNQYTRLMFPKRWTHSSHNRILLVVFLFVVAKSVKCFGAKLSTPRRTLQQEILPLGRRTLHLPLLLLLLKHWEIRELLGKWNEFPFSLTSFFSKQDKAVFIRFLNNA